MRATRQPWLHPVSVSNMIRRSVNIIHLWAKRLKIETYGSKSSFITLALKKRNMPSSYNEQYCNTYLLRSKLLRLDTRQKTNLEYRLKKKKRRKALDARLHIIRSLLRSKMNISNKLIIYKPFTYVSTGIWHPNMESR